MLVRNVFVLGIGGVVVGSCCLVVRGWEVVIFYLGRV
jgi:hypothetical protein